MWRFTGCLGSKVSKREALRRARVVGVRSRVSACYGGRRPARTPLLLLGFFLRRRPRGVVRREDHVDERRVRAEALQADRAAVRLPGAVPGPGGAAQSGLGHSRPLLPVPVGVVLPVRGEAAGRGGFVELLLHSHFWSENYISFRVSLISVGMLSVFGWDGEKVWIHISFSSS